MGEMDAATLAGIMAATAAQTASALAATASASGSQKETSYNWLEISRPAPMASGSPNATRPHADQSSAEYVSNHFGAVGAQRHANPDLIPSLRNGVGRHSVESDRGQQQRHKPEQSGKAGDGAFLIKGELHLLFAWS